MSITLTEAQFVALLSKVENKKDSKYYSFGDPGPLGLAGVYRS